MIQFLIGTLLGFRVARKIWLELSGPSKTQPKRIPQAAPKKPAAVSVPVDAKGVDATQSTIEDHYEPILPEKAVKPSPPPPPATKKPLPAPAAAAGKNAEKFNAKNVPKDYQGSLDDLIEDDEPKVEDDIPPTEEDIPGLSPLNEPEEHEEE